MFVRVARVAVVLLSVSCAPKASVAPSVLAAADPKSRASDFEPPADPLRSERPRTLDLEIDAAAKTRGHDEHEEPAATPTPKVKATPTPKATPDERMYVCPMHPEVRQKGPGSCPKCGMDLVVERKAAPAATPKASPSPTGHENHGDHR